MSPINIQGISELEAKMHSLNLEANRKNSDSELLSAISPEVACAANDVKLSNQNSQD